MSTSAMRTARAQSLLVDVKCVTCRPREACTDPRCVLFGTEKTAIGNGCLCDNCFGVAAKVAS